MEAVLTLYAEDVLFTSPTAQRVVPESGGTVEGKQTLRSYWTQALEGNRDLHFELVGVYHGVDTIALHYRNQLGGLVNEVLTFRDGLVAVGHGLNRCADAVDLEGNRLHALPVVGHALRVPRRRGARRLGVRLGHPPILSVRPKLQACGVPQGIVDRLAR